MNTLIIDISALNEILMYRLNAISISLIVINMQRLQSMYIYYLFI